MIGKETRVIWVKLKSESKGKFAYYGYQVAGMMSTLATVKQDDVVKIQFNTLKNHVCGLKEELGFW